MQVVGFRIILDEILWLFSFTNIVYMAPKRAKMRLAPIADAGFFTHLRQNHGMVITTGRFNGNLCRSGCLRLLSFTMVSGVRYLFFPPTRTPQPAASPLLNTHQRVSETIPHQTEILTPLPKHHRISKPIRASADNPAALSMFHTGTAACPNHKPAAPQVLRKASCKQTWNSQERKYTHGTSMDQSPFSAIFDESTRKANKNKGNPRAN